MTDPKLKVNTLRADALRVLQCRHLDQKVHLAGELSAQSASFLIANEDFSEALEPDGELPGQPEKPVLMQHLDVPQRSIHTPRGLAGLAHSVCHIEFNAINLALDAVWRFPSMPAQYYVDWLRVAAEEAHHFALLRAQLRSMGYDYGDFPAHTGLWDMVERTQGDIVARMALVPRTLEARGLDATPPMQAKLRKVGTPDALKLIEILDLILRDEVGHVAIGNHWYRWLCERDGLEPVAHFRKLCEQHAAPRVRAPINEEARRLAGFTDAEISEILLNS
ncbi:ferritin-like domain-containing protein [Variovorax sp. PCZ-1]|uniref:ferritin-like domain-containing protein n=1 Tax=Variovorax sp. PCZ-1 TaxID=2835533 RepID=UPI001BCA729E|nr:ferritin-like domain-containing protein [Variovorax sp. PCZ-1]MBS7808517.1 ferritin-like domain-containing protein [Variovorax sp. PCZ-1]